MTIGSLFSGIGGLELGLEACRLGPVIWQAESDPYARAVLAKHWPTVRRYEDVREIDAQSPPPDIICGGFPCQDISNAGKRAGIGGARSGLWSEFARIVRDLRPRVVFVENVAALVSRGLDVVLGDLAALGFDAEWGLFRASDVGAPNRRERVFVLAYTGRVGFEWIQSVAEPGCCDSAAPGGDDSVADAASERGRGLHARPRTEGNGAADADRSGEELADAIGEAGRPAPGFSVSSDGPAPFRDGAPQPGRRGSDVADTSGERGQARRTEPADRQQGRPGTVDGGHRFPPGPGVQWDGPQPAIRRGDDGVPRRVDRLRCLGNAVVPAQAALAWRTLTARLRTQEAA